MKLKSLLLGGAIALAFGAISTSADDVEFSGTPSVTLYSFPNQSGRSVVLNRDTPKLKKIGFAANAMSMNVSGGNWEVCESNQYNGTCEVFGPGSYNFGIFNWGNKIKSVRRIRAGTPTITLFARPNMQGDHHTYAGNVPRIKDFATNDFAHSVKISGGDWVLCQDSAGKGKCETVRRDVANLSSLNLAGAISSLYRSADWNDDSLDGGSYGGGGYAGGDYGSGDGRYNGGGRRDDRYPEIVLFEGYNFTGPRITIDSETSSLLGAGFSNRASSVRISAGVWELCDGSNFTKTCRVVERNENNLGAIGLDSLITSLRPVADRYDGGGRGGGNGRSNARGYEGQRTVFFAEPTLRGEPVASCLYRNSQCGITAANAFCRESDLGNAAYFDQARSYRAPYIIGERRIASNSGQQRLIDVLCRR